MRVFQSPGGVQRLSLEARIVYSGFCVFMLLGLATSVWFYRDDGLGAGAASATRYYLGGEPGEAAKRAEPPPSGGPVIALPGGGEASTPAAGLILAKPPRQVMETFHFHLFSASVCLLIIAHLFMLGTALSSGVKLAIIGATGAGTLGHILSPPLIVFVSPGLGSALMFPSGALMLAGWTYMTGHSLFELWRPSGQRLRTSR